MRRIALVVCVLASVTLPTLITSAAVYDLSGDFSPSTNPNGVWTFGAKPRLDGPLSVFGVRGLNPFQYWQLVANQDPTIYRNGTSNTIGSGQGVFPPGTVFLYSGTDGLSNGYGVVRFTVPADGSGEHHIAAAVRPIYDGSLQGDTDFHVVKNGTELFGRFLAPADQSGYSNTLSLAAGDTIDFMVGRGQDNSGVSSGLKIQVTITSSPPPPPQRVRYDLSGDFSPSTNPNGVWAFGAKPSLGGSLSVFGIRGLNPFQYWQLVASQEPTIYRNGTSNTITLAGGQGVFPPGTVFLYSGTDGVSNGFGVVRFTVPAGGAGEHQIEAAVRPVYDGSLQGDTDFHVVKNGTELFGRFLAPADQSGYSNTLTLAAGDTMDFMVGRGQDGHGAFSGLKIQLTISTPSPPPQPPGTNCVPAPSGLAAWWPFDGNLQEAVNGAPSQPTGSPVFAPGQVSQALRFDGVVDGVVAAPTPALNVGTAEGFSIETWVKPAHVTMQPLVEWSPAAGVGGVHFWLGVYGSGSIYANVVDVGGGQHSWRSDTGIVVPNVFQHVGMSYDKASGTLRFYLNGQKVTEYHLGTFTPQTTYPMLIGHRLGQEHFAGLVDELSIYGRVLSDAEFALIHAAGAAGKCRPTEPPPPQEPRYVLSQDFSATDNPSAPWSYGAKNSFTGPLSLFAIHGTVPDQTGRPFQYWQLVPLQEPTLFHNGTDGTNRTAGGQGTFPPGSTFLYSGTDGAANQYGVVRFTTPAGAAGNYEVAAGARPVYDGPLQGDTDFHVLKNGIELFGRFLAGAQTTQFGTIVSLAAGDTVELVVGRGQDGSGVGSGLKIEAVIAPTTNAPPPPNTECVSAPAGLVEWWPLEGSAADAAGNSDGILAGGPVFEGGQVGQGLRFDGVDDHIRVPASAALDAGAGAGVTIELWLKPEDLNAPRALLEWSTTTGPQPGLHFYTSVSSPGSLFANLTDTSGLAHHFNSASGVLAAGVFQHVAFTYDRTSGVARFYVNGANVAENTIGSLRLDTRPDLWIGQRPLNGPAYLFRGTMDEISLYNRALSAGEIQAIHQAGAAGKCSLPSTGNHAPVAKARIEPVFEVQPEATSFLVIAANGIEAEVALDGSQSSDADNDALDYLWVEEGQALPFATGARATNSFGLGEHVVTLVVSDGQETGHDTVTFEVITLSDAVNELILFLTETELERRNKRPLLVTLNAAWESFEDGDLGAGVKYLQVFQQKVRAQVARDNPAAAARLIAGAQQIIEAVEAEGSPHGK